MKRNLHAPHQGQTLVEFALILPIFLFLVVVIFDFGRAVYYYNAIQNAAREGARFGVTDPTNFTGMQAEAEKYAIGLGLTDLTVTAQPGSTECFGTLPNPGMLPCATGIPRPTINVHVTYKYIPVTPFVTELIPCGCNYILLKADANMRTESLH